MKAPVSFKIWNFIFISTEEWFLPQENIITANYNSKSYALLTIVELAEMLKMHDKIFVFTMHTNLLTWKITFISGSK